MSLLVIIAVAVAIFVLAVVAVRVWVHRSRARPERPVSEAEGAGSRVAADTERPVGQPAAWPRAHEAALTLSDVALSAGRDQGTRLSVSLTKGGRPGRLRGRAGLLCSRSK